MVRFVLAAAAAAPLAFALSGDAALDAARARQDAGLPVDTSQLSEMRWRMIGPHRASRSKAIAGIPDQPLGSPSTVS